MLFSTCSMYHVIKDLYTYQICQLIFVIMDAQIGKLSIGNRILQSIANCRPMHRMTFMILWLSQTTLASQLMQSPPSVHSLSVSIYLLN